MTTPKLLQLVMFCAVFSSLVCGVPDAPCDCTDDTPRNGVSCEEQRAKGNCAFKWMKKNEYCSITCGYCKCDKEPVSAPAVAKGCDWCTDIPPSADYTCEEQAELGKCVRGWMDGFCMRTCKKCSCDSPPVIKKDTAEPSTPDDTKPDITSAESFEIPKLVAGISVPAADVRESEVSFDEKPQATNAGNATQLEEAQVQTNSTASIAADEGTQVLNNATSIPPTVEEARAALQGQNSTADSVPSAEVADEGLPVQTNATSIAPTVEETRSALQGQNNSTDSVPAAEEVSVAPQDESINGTLPDSQGVNSTDVSPEPEMESGRFSGSMQTTSASVVSGESNGTDAMKEDGNETTGEMISSAVPESDIYGEQGGSISVRPGCQTIMELISRNGNLTRLAEAARVAGIELALEDSAMDITFFAPTNRAFEILSNLIGDGAGEILSRPVVMKLVLSNHASRPSRKIYDALNAQTIKTLSIVEGDERDLRVTRGPDGKIWIDGKISRAQVLTQDIHACGGYLHIIDAVLSPIGYNELGQVS